MFVADVAVPLRPGITNIIFLGHLEHDKLGAGTLATMYIQITGNSIGQGLATAMDTYVRMRYCGALWPRNQ
jgi:Na+-driven multidrug efflux pump